MLTCAVYIVTTMGVRYKVNENFFKTWHPTMAYILGYLYADGSLEYSPYIRGKYIRVTSIDRKSIFSIRTALESEHTISVIPPSTPNSKARYFLRIGSSVLYDSLSSLGLHPKKSLTIQMPRIPTEYLGHFVRGYFDGDGCVYWQKQTKGVKHSALITVFSSGSKVFLEKLSDLIVTHSAALTAPIHRVPRAYQLRMSTRSSVGLFILMYKDAAPSLFLERKLQKFVDYFIDDSKRIGEEEEKVLQSFNGLMVKR